MKRYLLIIALGSFMLSSCATRVVTTTPAPRTNVVVVKKAPRNHKVVVVKGKRYYTWNGKYYTKTRRGYVVTRI